MSEPPDSNQKIIRGDFLQRGEKDGVAQFDVTLQDDRDYHDCITRLDLLGIRVDADAALLGHFAIKVKDPEQWAEIGSVICGEIVGNVNGIKRCSRGDQLHRR